jgi:AraC-like DNA-binding protein
MSAKSLSRLVRVNKAIRLLRNPHNSITFSGEYTGFYDLPHFVHDFKSVCGLTPQEYRNNMSDFYSEIAKF